MFQDKTKICDFTFKSLVELSILYVYTSGHRKQAILSMQNGAPNISRKTQCLLLDKMCDPWLEVLHL